MEVGPRRSFSRVALVLGCLSALALPGAPGGMNERAHREPDSPLRSAQVLAEHLDPNAVPEFGKLLADAYGAQNTALFTETAIAQTKLLGNLGRTSEATASFQLARAAAARSRVTRADALVLEVLAALTARGAGRRDEAIQRARKLVETAHALPAEMELNRAEVLMGVSATLTYQETQAEAEAAVREALEIRRRRLGENNVRTCMTYDNLSGILGVQGKLEEALEASRRAHACVEVAAGAESALRGEVDVNLGDALALTGRIEAARAIDEEGLRILGKELGPTNADVLMLENNLARLSLVDRPREAAEHYERTLFASEHTLPPAAPERLRSVVGAERCRAWRSVARAREAVVQIREALAGQVNDPSGGSDFDVAVTMFALAETIERAQPHTAEARDLAQRALVHFDRLHCVFDRDRVQAWLRSLPT